MTNKSCDFLVIGAGVIGLAIAREILLNSKNSKVIIVEKETEVGLHASGRNSGVLHAGFYYSPDSLKAKFCLEGNIQLTELAARHKIPVRRVGKVVVARNKSESERIDLLYRRGITNGVKFVDTCASPCCGATELERITQDLERLAQQATNIEGFLSRLQISVQTMDMVVLGSRLNDRSCAT